MVKIGVYGSLRGGEYNSFLMGDAKFLNASRINGFKLYSLGSYPAIRGSSNPDDSVVVEVFEFDEEDKSQATTLKMINDMEIGAGYSIKKTRTVDGDCVSVYVYDSELPDNRLIANGDWCNRN